MMIDIEHRDDSDAWKEEEKKNFRHFGTEMVSYHVGHHASLRLKSNGSFIGNEIVFTFDILSENLWSHSYARERRASNVQRVIKLCVCWAAKTCFRPSAHWFDKKEAVKRTNVQNAKKME